MKPTSYQNFARLLESIVMEASTGMDLVRNTPGGREIVQHLHRNTSLGHDADWEVVKKIPWSEMKGSRWDNSGGGWIILIGQHGVGAIRARGQEYSVSASNGNPPAVNQDTGRDSNRFFNITSESGGRSLDIIKNVIGPIRSFVISKNRGEVAKKKAARDAIRKAAVKSGGRDIESSEDAQQATEAMLMRFKPLWTKMVTQAMADIKGFVGLQIKNHAFGKVQGKINRLQNLEVILDALQSRSMGGDDDESMAGMDTLRNSISSAVDLAARHYYPDQMGNRTFSSRYSYGPPPDGVKLLLNDIAKGDTRKLGTVLGFFKRALLTS